MFCNPYKTTVHALYTQNGDHFIFSTSCGRMSFSQETRDLSRLLAHATPNEELFSAMIRDCAESRRNLYNEYLFKNIYILESHGEKVLITNCKCRFIIRNDNQLKLCLLIHNFFSYDLRDFEKVS